MSDGQEVYERVYRRFQHIMEVGGERERERKREREGERERERQDDIVLSG